MLSRNGVDHRHRTHDLACNRDRIQSSRPSNRQQRADLIYGQHCACCGEGGFVSHPGIGDDSIPVLIHLHAPIRQILERLHAADKRVHLAKDGGNNSNAGHYPATPIAAGKGCRTYPCCTNHAAARRRASCTGNARYPSSRSALADEANIFLRPMRTASSVARGSLRRSTPVKNWSNAANPNASPCGTLVLGDARPVISASISRICFNVRFSPPRIYRSPGFAFSIANRCPRATSFTSARLSPVST